MAALPIIADDLTSLLDSLDLDDLDALIDGALAAAEAVPDAADRAAQIAAALDALSGISASAVGTEVTVALTAATDATVDIVDGDIGLGGAAFSLDAEASFSGTIDVAVDLNFTYDTSSDTLTLIDTPQEEILLTTGISADVSAAATIAGGFVGVELTDTQVAPELALTAGFNFASLNPADITATYGGNAGLRFDLATVVANGLLPGVTASIAIDWDPLDPTMAPAITFTDVGISVGELVDAIVDLLQPLTDILFEGIIGDIVAILTDPVPIINDGLNAVGLIDLFDTIPTSGDGIFNLLDGLGIYFESTGNTQAVTILSGFAEALAILKQLNDFAQNNGIIPLGDINIPGFDSAVDPPPPASFAVADIGGMTPLEFLSDLANTANLFQTALEAIPGLTDAGLGSLGTSTIEDESGLSFPLFENPELILNVLLPELTGNVPVPIIQYDIPEISAEARFGEYFFRIFGPFGLTIDGFAEASIDFIVGYDTYPLTVPNGTFTDGLFLTTLQMEPGEMIERQPEDRQFEFRPIAYSSAGIFAGVAVDAVVLRVGVKGGITGFVAAFLPGGEVDEGETPNGVLRLSDFGSGCFLDPILGRIGAEVVASIKVGYSIFSFEYDVTIADITIANFEFGCPPATEEIDGLARFVNGSDVLLHVGPEIGNRIIDGQPDTDINETYRISQGVDDDGLPVPGALRVEYAGFFQNFGVDGGEPAPTEIIANFGDGDDALVMSADLAIAVSVSGGAGNDILEGAALADSLSGDDGNDRLFGRAGNDSLYGGEGADYLEGGAGADILDGGEGRDRVSYEESAVGVTLNWNGSEIIGSGGDAEGDVLISIEYLVGSAFDDVLTGNPNEDSTLQGGDGDDGLLGGSGNDFLLGDGGADYMDGGDGDDGTSYVTSSGAVRVDLQSGEATGGDAEGDQLISIESVMGSAFYDVLLGNAGRNAIAGWVGDDIIDGRGGDDEITADVGDDIVYGRGDGAALLDGGAGRDLLSYERAGGPVTVDLAAGTGQGSGTDTIGFEQIDDGAGGLIDSTRSSFEDLDGGASGDDLTGDEQGNTIRGLGGSDTIDGGLGNDTLIGGFGADAMTGGAGTDWADYMDGFGVSVFLTGGPGSGSTAEGDTLTEIENLRGSDGSDFLGGDAGDNILAPMLSDGAMEAVDGLGLNDSDTLDLDYSRQDWGLGLVGGVSTGRFERFAFDGTTLLDGVFFSRIENFVLRGTIRDDTVDTGDGNDRIYLGGGDDTADAGSGVDVVLAQEGNDTVLYESDEDIPLFYLDGGRDFDGVTLRLGDVDEDMVVRAGFGDRINLILSSGASVVNFENLDYVQTGQGADLIEQGGISDNHLRGGGNADVIDPGRGIDLVNGGSEVVTTALSFDVGDRPVYVLTDPAQLFDFVTADVLRLDWSDVTSAISSTVDRFVSGTAGFVLNQVTVLLPFYTQNGTYETADGLDRTDFFNIEAVDITGGSGNDVLIGTWAGIELALQFGDTTTDPLSLPSDRGNDSLFGGDGDDVLIGLTGSDILEGGAGDDDLIGSDPAIAAGDNPQAPYDSYEIDTLTGGDGADRFVLGVLDLDDNPQSFYLGRVNAGDDATDSRAIITDFDASEGDRLVLAGSAGDYLVEEVAGGVNILLDQADRNIIAFLDGVDSLVLGAGNSEFESGGIFVPDFPIIPVPPVPVPPLTDFLLSPISGDIDLPLADIAVEDFVVIPDLAISAPGFAGADDLVLGALADVPVETVSFALASAEALAPETEALALDAVDDLVLDTDPPWVTQSNDPAALLDCLFEGVTGEITGGTLTLEGDGRAFGLFDGDPFGMGKGIVLSTGIAEDLDGRNEIDGGLFGPYAPELEFERIGAFSGSAIFRADLSFVGTVLNSITIADDGDAFGGGTQELSGLDLDALVLSRQLITAEDIANGIDFNDPTQFERLDVFNYASAFSQFAPGSIRSNGGPAVADLEGTENGIIDLTEARLGAFDFGVGPGPGFFTMGDGGTVGFDLTESVDTDGPLYLYVAEAGDNEELEARVTASDARLASPADLSTDFGAAGAEDDLIRLTYSFDMFEDAGKMLQFDFAFLTEELREFAGTEFNDALRIYLNGVQLAELSDGTALTVSQLLPAPFSAAHPDLVYNNVADGPVRDDTRADAFTTPITFMGQTQFGANELVIEIEDVRDGLMDSAVLIQAGTLDVDDGDDGGVIDLPTDPNDPERETPGVEIETRAVTVVEGEPAVEIDITLTGIAGLLDDVVLTLTPGGPDIDLGSGAGVAHELTFPAGGLLTQTLAVSAPNDGLVEPTELVLASVEVGGAAAFAGLPVAPILVTVIDADREEPERFEISLGDAPDRFSRRDPTAWSDAWTDEDVTIEQSADAGTGGWAPINLTTLNPGTFGGSSLYQGDLGVSGVAGTNLTGPPQEIDGPEGLRFALADGLTGTAFFGAFAGFDPGEAARVQLFEDGALVDTFLFAAADGPNFGEANTGDYDALVITSGSLAPDGVTFVPGALEGGAAPVRDAASQFRLEDLALSGFVDDTI